MGLLDVTFFDNIGKLAPINKSLSKQKKIPARVALEKMKVACFYKRGQAHSSYLALEHGWGQSSTSSETHCGSRAVQE